MDGTETDASKAESSPDLGDIGNVSDEGLFDSIFALAASPAWIFGAGAVVSLTALSAAAFFIIRSRRRRQSLFQQLSGRDERGGYAPVGDDVQMGLLGRGRRKLMGGGGGESGTSKVLYDAFAEGESEDDEYDDGRQDAETVALKYHDDFLMDEGEEKAGGPSAAGYELDDDEEGTRTPTQHRLSGDSP